MLIGQEGLQSQIINLLNGHKGFPHTVILVGEKGQGKRTIARWIAEQMDAPVYEPKELKIDFIRELNSDSRTVSSPKLYLLADCETMTPQAQNALLKLSEEPPENAYIVMTVQDVSALLPTIISRSSILSLEGYTHEQLSGLTTDEQLIKIAKNPGTIERLQQIDYQTLLTHSDKVVANIGRISVSNAFNILKDVEKEDYDLFMSMLIYSYESRQAEGFNCTKQIRVLFHTKELMKNKSLNKQNALEMMFIELREAAISEI